MQLKEAKWFEVEKLMVDYARDDLLLRKKLCEVKYLCDDSSTGRGIHNVISENDKLREEVKDKSVVIDHLRSKVRQMEESGDSTPKHPVRMARLGGGTGGASIWESQRSTSPVPRLDLKHVKNSSKVDWY